MWSYGRMDSPLLFFKSEEISVIYFSNIISFFFFFLNFLLSYLLGETYWINRLTKFKRVDSLPLYFLRIIHFAIASLSTLYLQRFVCVLSLFTWQLVVDPLNVVISFPHPHLNLFDLPAPLCGSPGEVTNGGRKGQIFRHPAVVTYYCHEGYQLIGNPRRQCQADGKWSGSLPLCRRKFFLSIY